MRNCGCRAALPLRHMWSRCAGPLWQPRSPPGWLDPLSNNPRLRDQCWNRATVRGSLIDVSDLGGHETLRLPLSEVHSRKSSANWPWENRLTNRNSIHLELVEMRHGGEALRRERLADDSWNGESARTWMLHRALQARPDSRPNIINDGPP